MIGKLKNGEIREFMKEASDSPGSIIPAGDMPDFTVEKAVNEAGRCMRCDCGKSETCELRKYAEQYGADRLRYKSRDRKNYIKETGHRDIIYEPGKCIKCGRCVKITEKSSERLGLSFIGRGFDTVIGVPFNEPLSKGLEKVQKLCVDKCPTGALSFKRKPFKK
jgi:NADH dehydrogenase/NADH:ubiquinone oxidoreductase subunit G